MPIHLRHGCEKAKPGERVTSVATFGIENPRSQCRACMGALRTVEQQERDRRRVRDAAPDLLAAIGPLIRTIHDLLPRHMQPDSTLDTLPAVQAARAAIAKATTP